MDDWKIFFGFGEKNAGGIPLFSNGLINVMCSVDVGSGWSWEGRKRSRRGRTWVYAVKYGSVFLKILPWTKWRRWWFVCIPAPSEKTDSFIYLSKFPLLSAPHPSPFLPPAFPVSLSELQQFIESSPEVSRTLSGCSTTFLQHSRCIFSHTAET